MLAFSMSNIPDDIAILANQLYDVHCGSKVTTRRCFQIRPKNAEYKGIYKETD